MDKFRKMLKISIILFGFIIGSFVIIKYGFASKNKGDKYYKEYVDNSMDIKVKIPNDYKKNTKQIGSYHKGIFFYKAIQGKYYGYKFYDSTTNKYFNILMYDIEHGENIAQNYCIEGENIIISVNKDELGNKLLGTKENPIPIFRMKGEKLSKMDNGEHRVSQQEYEHNVKIYLTYIMPKEEFKERFEKK